MIDRLLQDEAYAKIQKEEMLQNLDQSIIRMSSIADSILDKTAKEMAQKIGRAHV